MRYKETEQDLQAIGVVAEEPTQNKDGQSSCDGCVFLNGAEVGGLTCPKVPCTEMMMGRDVIWIKRES